MPPWRGLGAHCPLPNRRICYSALHGGPPMLRIALLASLFVVALSPAAPAWDRGQATTFARLPAGERNPEGIAVDRRTGDVYVADFDFRGTNDGKAHVHVFDKAGAMLVANTGDDTVVKIPPGGGVETATVLTNSINGADGLLIDEDGNIWVCANQSDEIVVIDPTGKAIAKLGDFDGISERGEARGFLFPASPVFAGEFVLVTNLALDTNLFGFNSVDAGWAAQVKTYTVSKIKRRIPPIHGD